MYRLYFKYNLQLFDFVSISPLITISSPIWCLHCASWFRPDRCSKAHLLLMVSFFFDLIGFRSVPFEFTPSNIPTPISSVVYLSSLILGYAPCLLFLPCMFLQRLSPFNGIVLLWSYWFPLRYFWLRHIQYSYAYLLCCVSFLFNLFGLRPPPLYFSLFVHPMPVSFRWYFFRPLWFGFFLS